MSNKETGIENDDKYPVLGATKLKIRSNKRLRIRSRDVRILHCALCRLNGLIYFRCKRHLKLYGR
jgi:hypothetical protein